MTTCKHCGKAVPQIRAGRKLYCNSKCKDKWRYYNSPKRKVNIESTKTHRRESGYHKKRYQDDIEYQRSRALTYYYENRDRILEQKRNNEGKKGPVEDALIKIRSGRATYADAWDYMEDHLGYHSCEIEDFIVSMLDD